MTLPCRSTKVNSGFVVFFLLKLVDSCSFLFPIDAKFLISTEDCLIKYYYFQMLALLARVNKAIHSVFFYKIWLPRKIGERVHCASAKKANQKRQLVGKKRKLRTSRQRFVSRLRLRLRLLILLPLFLPLHLIILTSICVSKGWHRKRGSTGRLPVGFCEARWTRRHPSPKSLVPSTRGLVYFFNLCSLFYLVLSFVCICVSIWIAKVWFFFIYFKQIWISFFLVLIILGKGTRLALFVCVVMELKVAKKATNLRWSLCLECFTEIHCILQKNILRFSNLVDIASVSFYSFNLVGAQKLHNHILIFSCRVVFVFLE